MSKKQVCRFFNTSKGYRRGQQCNFLHDSSAGQDQGTTPRPAYPQRSQDFQQWLYQVPLPGRASAPLGTRLPGFFTTALELLAKDTNIWQEVVMKLAGEGGLQRINEAIELISSRGRSSPLAQRRLFEDTLLLILQILTAEGPRSSFVLETSFSTIFKYLFGIDGRRATLLFTNVTSVLTEMQQQKAEGVAEALRSGLGVFRAVTVVNRDAPVCEALSNLAKVFRDLVSQLDCGIKPSLIHAIQSDLEVILLRFGQGEVIAEIQPPTVLVKKATYRFKRDGPGHLSKSGVRHDNDFANIRQIQIMPTAQEIQSTRTEYLPSSNLFEHHHQGIEALLDRQFRLLYEDTIGVLRDAVRTTLERNKEPGIASRQKQQQMRTVAYANASLHDIRFSKLRVIDLIYSFDQPRGAASSKSKHDR